MTSSPDIKRTFSGMGTHLWTGWYLQRCLRHLMLVLCKQLAEFRLDKQSLVRLRENCLGGKCKILEDLFLCLGPSKANMSSPLLVAYSVCVSRKGLHVLSEVRLIYSIMNQFLPCTKKFCTIYKNS